MSIENAKDNIEKIYADIENELLMNIANKIKKGKPMQIKTSNDEVNEWQLEMLKELDGLNEENIKTIAKYSNRSIKEIKQMFDIVEELGNNLDKNTIKKAETIGALNEVNKELLKIKTKQIIESSINAILTTFNSQNNSLLKSAGDEYTKVINRVSSHVMAGIKTPQKAVQEAVSELAESGLTGFTARNGAKWSPEAYTKMVIHSNVKNTINAIQEENILNRGGNYIEISQHAGARPLCSQDQGKVFSLNGDTTPIKDSLGRTIKVYDWKLSSYGEPAGILGINCGHTRRVFIPNVSIHRDKPIKKFENDEEYRLTQKQRLFERTIRNKKREIAMLEKTGAEKEFIKKRKAQLKGYQNQYSEFIKSRTKRSGATSIY